MSKLVVNKKIKLNFEVMDTFEAGIQLVGHEVKSVKKKQGSLEGSHVIIRAGEAFLIGSNIPPYQAKNTPASYDPYRNRKLLLNKKEIAILAGNEKAKGLTIVPISLYTKGNTIKVEIAVVRGKKKYDKRQDIKKRDIERELQRKL
ncbi:SsrA-binding protein [Candidatus Wolfebacteria bacterium]|nr:MAG: SsrA-binding protein [Candidatus Wolfebacteria bacterium]